MPIFDLESLATISPLYSEPTYQNVVPVSALYLDHIVFVLDKETRLDAEKSRLFTVISVVLRLCLEYLHKFLHGLQIKR